MIRSKCRYSRSGVVVVAIMETPTAKRKRKAFSCYDCRRRKLKCDREHPACSRCRKSGHADTCRYGSGPGDEEDEESVENGDQTATPATAPNHSAAVIQNSRPSKYLSNGTSERSSGQTRRIAQLEHRLAMLEGKGTGPPALTGRLDPAIPVKSLASTEPKNADSAKREVLGMLKGKPDSEPMIFRKKGFKTQYYGTSHLATYLVHVCSIFYSACSDKLQPLLLKDCIFLKLSLPPR